MTILLAAQFMANMDNTVVNVAAPSIGSTLHASGAELQLTVSVYVLASAMLLITSARLGKMFGCRPMYLIGLGVFTAASLCSGLAPNAPFLILSRVLQGVGTALMVAQVLTSIQLYYTGHSRVRAIASYTLTLSLSGVAGQAFGGALVSANLFGTAWRPIFLLNVPIGIVLFVLAERIFPRGNDAGRGGFRLDPAGIAIFSAATLLVVLPLTLGRELGWPVWAWSSLIAGAAAIAGFVVWEQRLSRGNRMPLVNTLLFSSPVVSRGLIALAFTRTAVFSLFFVVALYLQAGLGHSAVYSGFLLIWWGIAYGVAGPVYPRIPRRLAYLCGPFGCALLALSFFGMSVAALNASADGPVLVGIFLLGGFGFGILSTALMSMLTGAISREHASDLSGILSTMVPLAAVIGIATFGSIYLSLAGASGGALRAFSIVTAAFAASAALAAFAAVAAAGESRKAIAAAAA